jgi:TonB family protein
MLMLKTRRVVLSLLCFTMLAAGAQAASGGSRLSVIAQQSPAIDVTEDVKRAIELYKQNDDKGAIELLRRVVKVRKDVVAAWHFLGLAYERQGKSKDARKAHEEATKAGEMMLDGLFTALAIHKDASVIEQFKPLLLLAAESADRYLKLSSKPSTSKVEEWNFRAETLRDYAGISANNSQSSTLGKIYKPSDVTTKARVLQRRVEPSYTEEARKNGISGTVVLRGVVAFDGKFRGIRVVSGLPYGLTERAIEAARKIRFAPAMLDGQPVSQYIQIEYNFNLF